MARIGKLASAAVLLALIGAGNASADGALAVGSTGRVSVDGVAYGYVGNRSATDAVRIAMDTCSTYNAPNAAAQCMIVATIRDECIAVANDPQPGTPGTAWAVHPSRAVADSARWTAAALPRARAGGTLAGSTGRSATALRTARPPRSGAD